MTGPDIRPIAFSDELFAPLLAECEAEGGSFLLRLRDEWRSGATRFDRPGEALFGAFARGRLVGVGGLTQDPWEPGVGRLRHLYVIREMRGRGAGAALVARIVEQARGTFPTIRLRTRCAGSFYEGLGFTRSDAERETHRLVLRNRVSA